jgi:hypothetical protein
VPIEFVNIAYKMHFIEVAMQYFGALTDSFARARGKKMHPCTAQRWFWPDHATGAVGTRLAC